MLNYKKVTILIWLACLFVVLIAACGSPEGYNNSSQTQEVASTPISKVCKQVNSTRGSRTYECKFNCALCYVFDSGDGGDISCQFYE